MKKLMAAIISISTKTTDPSTCKDTGATLRCGQCGQILPIDRSWTVSRHEAIVGTVCGLVLIAILATAVYFATKWAVDHVLSFPTNPPWREPLDDWFL